ncbi:MAG: SMC-Scp complex subunit ScpB [Actinomycetota bacterium]|nr:MAG: SMC-Scp complex subunit ScpB [Actinomycetota bacterium]
MDSKEASLNSFNFMPGSRELEAVLMVSAEPVSLEQISDILDISGPKAEQLLEELAEFYLQSDRGFYIQKVAEGYRYAVLPELAHVMEKIAISQSPPRLSGAALETLAIIAYRQPISRAQIAAIRGVNSDYVIRMLESRGYIEPDARNPVPGTPLYYSTTPMFLEKLGIFSLADLPRVEGFVPGPEFAEALETSLFDGTY